MIFFSGWMQPARHALGALLLEQNRVEEAEVVYLEDLGMLGTIPRQNTHPKCIWSLKGLSECFERLGRSEAQSEISEDLAVAMSLADTEVVHSCACRVGSPT